MLRQCWHEQGTNPAVPVPLEGASSSILGDPATSVFVVGAGLAQSIPLQVEALGTVCLRDPRVADQHWRLQNDRFCDALERSGIHAPGGLTICILNYDSQTCSSNRKRHPCRHLFSRRLSWPGDIQFYAPGELTGPSLRTGTRLALVRWRARPGTTGHRASRRTGDQFAVT